MQLSTEEFLTLQDSIIRKGTDNALLQREIERLTGEVKRLSEENERLRGCQAGASPAEARNPGYVLLSIDAICNLFRSLRNVKFVSFLYFVFSKIMPPDAMQRISDAASLEGATPENGYRPNEPYTVTMHASVNKHQDMQLFDGRVMYIYIMGKGWDTEQRSIEIVKTSTSELCQVFNCPALLTQCKRIQGTWNGLK